ncbi:lytic transglycosylase domain-containing protein [Blastococcus capsensis]|uniref:lytic transglycosylase domain-containing protein n=1 Tax=Blastococcus capsensis TaxID=1564163 RepID=UPI0025408934|nr:lytic murein transglycosylase [Blastococcus capsensis]MDK3256695.1 lytic murein transglycosylase [Blastococcus capsensis]
MGRTTDNGVGGSEPGGRGTPPGARPGRWLMVAAVVLGTAGLVAGTVQPDRTVPTGQTRPVADEDPSPAWSVPALSDGAPAGAITLPAAPAQVAQPQPATPEAVSGLAANGIPTVALNAYRVAAARMASAKPGCGIDWSLLAGIGRIESNHGRFGGAVLQTDGTSTPEIRGPALDGVEFAYIADSDDGVHDRDTRYDRAVGPMQFIPTTWRSYAIDADGNGSTDPFDIDDAALAAAHYLCVAGKDLRTDAGQRRAVFAYNHSDEYVAQVLALARAYAAGIPVDSLPLTGNTTGPVPPPSGNHRAPAAPGPAIGAADMTPASGNTVGQSTPPPAPPAGPGAPPPAPSGGNAAPPPAGSDTGRPPAQQAARPAPAPAPPPPPAPAPVPVVDQVTEPVQQVTEPVQQVTGPVQEVVEPGDDLVAGVSCTLLDPLGRPLLPRLPACPG